jgi:fumarate reductase flavoprotein subunit
VQEYNAAVAAKVTESLQPSRTVGLFDAMPVIKPPFYAIPLCAGITYTMGGIAIDAQCRVLDENDQPIPGLHAAGCTSGGVEGGVLAGYVGGLAKSGVTGLLAAETIATAAPREREMIVALSSSGR